MMVPEEWRSRRHSIQRPANGNPLRLNAACWAYNGVTMESPLRRLILLSLLVCLMAPPAGHARNRKPPETVAHGWVVSVVDGDTVRLAQRLEELGKTAWGGGNDAIILVSGDVADELGDDFELTARGNQEIRGRDGGLRVFRLASGAFDGSDSILNLTSEVDSKSPAADLKQPDPVKIEEKPPPPPRNQSPDRSSRTP